MRSGCRSGERRTRIDYSSSHNRRCGSRDFPSCRIETGATLRMKGKGMPILGSSGRGNELVTINVVVPTKLTEKQKDLLKQFKQIEDEKRKGFFKF